MLPAKRVHLDFPNEPQIGEHTIKLEERLDDFNGFDDDQNDDVHTKKQRKRRTLSETSKRDFVCGCGKSYVSYPAIYLHVQRKHNCEWPENTVIPEKPSSEDKVKRGRPKVRVFNFPVLKLLEGEGSCCRS